jgi:hypothetical protein
MDAVSKNSDTFAGCADENEAIDKLNESLDALINENTYPSMIEKFRDFDKKYMMPIFKRPTKFIEK